MGQPKFWNIIAGGQVVGRVEFGGSPIRYYYLKDHLGIIKMTVQPTKYDLNGNLDELQRGTNPFIKYTYQPNSNTPQSIGGWNYGSDQTGNIIFSGSLGVMSYYDPFTQLPMHGLNDYPLVVKNSSTENAYVYGPSGIVAVRVNGSWYYVMKDHLGSTRMVLNGTADVSAYYDYDPYGKIVRAYQNIDPKYQFTGQELESDLSSTSLWNFRAREFDSEVGLFYAPDPAGQTYSRFGYCAGNPKSFIDPTGMKWIYDPATGQWYWQIEYFTDATTNSSSSNNGGSTGLYAPGANGNMAPADATAAHQYQVYLQLHKYPLPLDVSNPIQLNLIVPPEWNPNPLPVTMPSDVLAGMQPVLLGTDAKPVPTIESAEPETIGGPFIPDFAEMFIRKIESRNSGFEMQPLMKGIIRAIGNPIPGIPSAKVVTVGKYTLSETVAKHLNDVSKKGRLVRPYLTSPLTIDQIIQGGVAEADVIPGWVKYVAQGTFGKSEGTWTIVIDPNTNYIYHYLFERVK